MPRVSPKLHKREYQGQTYYSHWCPACNHCHTYTIGGNRTWTFDGNVDKPTFHPSMREFVSGRIGRDGQVKPEYTICHYFLTAGVIKYCDDSPHELKGKAVELPDIPEDYGLQD